MTEGPFRREDSEFSESLCGELAPTGEIPRHADQGEAMSTPGKRAWSPPRLRELMPGTPSYLRTQAAFALKK